MEGLNFQDHLQEHFEFKVTRADGETILKQTFPSGADIHTLGELFRNFLRAVTYSDCTIDLILLPEEE